MKSSTAEITPMLGTAMDGGFYAGRIKIGDQAFTLIVSPKDQGEHEGNKWIGDYKDVPNALSWNDGQANTKAMAEAGSELAKWATGLSINGYADWFLPSQEELEIIYRNLKPTADENSRWARSGINLSAIEPTRPYTATAPAQTQAEAFQEGGEQAFETTWYWTSTQHASNTGYAWCQYFAYGDQDHGDTIFKFRARAVRRLPI